MELIEDLDKQEEIKESDDYVYLGEAQYPIQVEENTEQYLEISCSNARFYRRKKDGETIILIETQTSNKQISLWEDDYSREDYTQPAKTSYTVEAHQVANLKKEKYKPFTLNDLFEWCKTNLEEQPKITQ